MVAAGLTPAQLAHFEANGFVSVATISTDDEVAWLREVFERLFSSRAGWERGDFFDFAGTDEPERDPVLPQLVNPSRYEPELERTVFRANAAAMAAQLLGPGAELVYEHAMVKPARTGGATPWHQDEAFYPRYTDYRSVTFWMPLQAVDERNGCLEFVPGSHQGPLLEHGRLNGDPRIHGLEAKGADQLPFVRCPLPAGAATIHHSRTLHHAQPNRSDQPRLAYALGFGIHSKEWIVRSEFSWNTGQSTPRALRAQAAQTPLARCAGSVKDAIKRLLYH